MDRHLLDPAADTYATLAWLSAHGYLGAIISNLHPQRDDEPIFTRGFLAFGRPGEAAIIARSRDTLVWDGEKITVELRDENKGW
jgi:hypothetical protein